MILNIEPISGFGYVANKLEIRSISYDLDNGNNGVNIYYAFLDNNKKVQDGNMYFEPNEIEDWGLDDMFIINKVIDKLNDTLVDPIEIIEE